MFCRHYLAALALLPVLLAPHHSRAEARYTVTMLPDNFAPSDINNAGQMAGALDAGDSGLRAAIYSGGKLVDLGTFGGSYGYASAINEAGDVAGNFGAAAGQEHAFLYQAGAMHDLGAVYALGINAGGAVVGRMAAGTGSTGFVYRDGTLTDVGHLGNGNISLAAGINDTGQIVGESTIALDGQLPTHPYLYDSGRLMDLGTLANQGVSSAVAINNAGQIAGYSTSENGSTHAFFYDQGVMTDLGSFGGFDITIGGMNQLGQVVGTGNTRDGPDVAFISSNGALIDLNTLIDPVLGWAITSAVDLNDAGQIIGTACRATQCSAVRLDLAGAVPEPAGALLLAPGLLALLGVRSRRSGRPAFQARSDLRLFGRRWWNTLPRTPFFASTN